MIVALGQAKARDAATRKFVSSRKVYVEEYCVGARPGYSGKCFFTVRGLFGELETACGEQFSRRSAELLAVVSNQDPVGHLTHSWSPAVLAAIG